MLKPFLLSSEKGAATIVDLATADELKQVTIEKSAGKSHDEALRKDLWKKSIELTGQPVE